MTFVKEWQEPGTIVISDALPRQDHLGKGIENQSISAMQMYGQVFDQVPQSVLPSV